MEKAIRELEVYNNYFTQKEGREPITLKEYKKMRSNQKNRVKDKIKELNVVIDPVLQSADKNSLIASAEIIDITYFETTKRSATSAIVRGIIGEISFGAVGAAADVATAKQKKRNIFKWDC